MKQLKMLQYFLTLLFMITKKPPINTFNYSTFNNQTEKLIFNKHIILLHVLA